LVWSFANFKNCMIRVGISEPRLDLFVQAVDSGDPFTALMRCLRLLVSELFSVRCDKILE
jgi:hypothetical protein